MRWPFRKPPAPREPFPAATGEVDYDLALIATSPVYRRHIVPWMQEMHWDTLRKLSDPSQTRTLDDVRRLQGEADAYRGVIETPGKVIEMAVDARREAERQGTEDDFDGSGLGRVYASWQRQRDAA